MIVRNACPVNFSLMNRSEETFQNTGDLVRVSRESHAPLAVRTKTGQGQVSLTFEVLNAQIGYRENLLLTLEAVIPE